jgi:hypothetical protein
MLECSWGRFGSGGEKRVKMGKIGADLDDSATASIDMSILRALVDSTGLIGLSISPNGVLIVVGGILAGEGKKG